MYLYHTLSSGWVEIYDFGFFGVKMVPPPKKKKNKVGFLEGSILQMQCLNVLISIQELVIKLVIIQNKNGQ